MPPLLSGHEVLCINGTASYTEHSFAWYVLSVLVREKICLLTDLGHKYLWDFLSPC